MRWKITARFDVFILAKEKNEFYTHYEHYLLFYISEFSSSFPLINGSEVLMQTVPTFISTTERKKKRICHCMCCVLSSLSVNGFNKRFFFSSLGWIYFWKKRTIFTFSPKLISNQFYIFHLISKRMSKFAPCTYYNCGAQKTQLTKSEFGIWNFDLYSV